MPTVPWAPLHTALGFPVAIMPFQPLNPPD